MKTIEEKIKTGSVVKFEICFPIIPSIQTLPSPFPYRVIRSPAIRPASPARNRKLTSVVLILLGKLRVGGGVKKVRDEVKLSFKVDRSPLQTVLAYTPVIWTIILYYSAVKKV